MKSLNLIKHAKRLLLITLVSTGIAEAESLQVDYYGVVSSSADTNMLKMAQDVFFTQLKSIDSITVTDKRSDLSKTLLQIPEIDSSSKRIAFYAEIDEEKDMFSTVTWNCKFDAVSPEDGITYSKNETFESYYKILVNAKTSIESLLSQFREKPEKARDADSFFASGAGTPSDIDIESLAGTWTGEPNTDKIIILRGGRGFVIFKNGASMNIRIQAGTTGKNSVQVQQVGKPNASFFTELPRETALRIAPSASPITWNFTITSQNSLEGEKVTLLPDGDDASEGKAHSLWTRK